MDKKPHDIIAWIVAISLVLFFLWWALYSLSVEPTILPDWIF